MKLKMTVEEALELADEWSEGLTLYEGSRGWRAVCMLLAEEVRRRVGIGGELIAARRERDELAAELANAGDAEIDWLRNALEHIAGSCEGRAAEIAREALMGPNVPHEGADAATSRTLPLDVVVGPRGPERN